MADCIYCGKSSCVYDGQCKNCTVRRLSRLPGRSIGAVIAGVREREGDAAAEALKAAVAAEHQRLLAAGKL